MAGVAAKNQTPLVRPRAALTRYAPGSCCFTPRATAPPSEQTAPTPAAPLTLLPPTLLARSRTRTRRPRCSSSSLVRCCPPMSSSPVRGFSGAPPRGGGAAPRGGGAAPRGGFGARGRGGPPPRGGGFRGGPPRGRGRGAFAGQPSMAPKTVTPELVKRMDALDLDGHTTTSVELAPPTAAASTSTTSTSSSTSSSSSSGSPLLTVSSPSAGSPHEEPATAIAKKRLSKIVVEDGTYRYLARLLAPLTDARSLARQPARRTLAALRRSMSRAWCRPRVRRARRSASETCGRSAWRRNRTRTSSGYVSNVTSGTGNASAHISSYRLTLPASCHLAPRHSLPSEPRQAPHPPKGRSGLHGHADSQPDR